MAKLTYYEIKSARYVIDGTEVISDNVLLQFIKRPVNSPTMKGEKAEIYTLPISEISSVFCSDIEIPKFNPDDNTKRVEAVKSFLDNCIGQTCVVEDIAKGKQRVLTYIEFYN